ncbi:MAG: hypothetical protein V1754_03990 [Pseudomonadota bacterium]
MANPIKQLIWVVVISTVLVTQPSSAPSAVLRGTIKLPAKFKIHQLFRAPGFWPELANDVLETRPPLVDPRLSMVVLLEGAKLPEKPFVTPKIIMRDARFTPSVLAVPPNTTVAFENQDGSIHILEPANTQTDFPANESVGHNAIFSHTFSKIGTHQVRCSEVPHMIATILVTQNHLATLPEQDGIFSFPNVPNGAYTLKIWYFEKWIHIQPVIIKGTTSVEIRIPEEIETITSQD